MRRIGESSFIKLGKYHVNVSSIKFVQFYESGIITNKQRVVVSFNREPTLRFYKDLDNDIEAYNTLEKLFGSDTDKSDALLSKEQKNSNESSSNSSSSNRTRLYDKQNTRVIPKYKPRD